MASVVQEAIDRLNRSAQVPISEYRFLLTDELCAITQSSLSYFAKVNPAETILLMIGWSRTAMASCGTANKPLLYKLDETGLWGDAIRERGVVISNDYKNMVKPTKKGYPLGHVDVTRHMNLPIYENGKVALVVGVGNKQEPYVMEDARKIEQLISAVWSTLKSKL